MKTFFNYYLLPPIFFMLLLSLQMDWSQSIGTIMFGFLGAFTVGLLGGFTFHMVTLVTRKLRNG